MVGVLNSICLTLIILQHYIKDLLMFQTMNSSWSNSQSLKYQRFTPSGCKDGGIRIFEAGNQFL